MHETQTTAAVHVEPTRPRVTQMAWRVLGAGAVALVGLTSLSACTADEAEPTPSATQSTDAEPGVTDITDTPGSGENLVGALADTQVTTCERADDHWSVKGTVTNPTEAPASYRIYVSLLTAENDTRALTQVDVDPIDPAVETDWSTTIAVADKDLTCVLRVERYAAE